jgi:hypothetical protein
VVRCMLSRVPQDGAAHDRGPLLSLAAYLLCICQTDVRHKRPRHCSQQRGAYRVPMLLPSTGRGVPTLGYVESFNSYNCG